MAIANSSTHRTIHIGMPTSLLTWQAASRKAGIGAFVENALEFYGWSEVDLPVHADMAVA